MPFKGIRFLRLIPAIQGAAESVNGQEVKRLRSNGLPNAPCRGLVISKSNPLMLGCDENYPS
jgi:hypothetical protein